MEDLQDEIRACRVFASGRLTRGPVRGRDGWVHFLLDAGVDGGPLHCVCDGVTATNAMTYLRVGKEVTFEKATLRWARFRNVAEPTLVIHVRFASYGREANANSAPPGRY